MCKCDISKCKAGCCYNVPHSKFTLNTNKKRIVTPIIRLVESSEDKDGRKLYIPVTDTDFHKNKCPFLRDDYKCNIYDNRPWVCRVFGTPPKGVESRLLHCGWLEGRFTDNMIQEESEVPAYLLELMRDMLNGKIK